MTTYNLVCNRLWKGLFFGKASRGQNLCLEKYFKINLSPSTAKRRSQMRNIINININFA